MSSYYESEFKELCEIGCGGFSIVFKAKCMRNGKHYAIKKVPLNDEELTKALKEVNFLGTLNSDYIVEHIHSWIENNYYNTDDRYNQNSLLCNPEKRSLIHIQMELCSNTLDQLINSIRYPQKNSMTPNQYSVACDIFTQLLRCLQYLHERNPPIIHRDLKPQNILLSNADNNRCVKLSDFGLSTYHETEEQSHTSRTGTDGYRAPEVITGRNYTIKADIYSLGRIMEQLFNIDVNCESVTKPIEIHKKYEKLKEIFLLCLSPFISQRPNCIDMLIKRNEWKYAKDPKINLFTKINELMYETVFNFIFDKWPSITNIDFKLLKNCKYMSIIDELEENAIIVKKDGITYALRVSEHIDRAIEEPKIINELSHQQIKSIVCGNEYVLCLTNDMRVYSFGDNKYGQLGNGTHRSTNKPSVIIMLNDKRITDIRCGAYHSLALSETGRVYAWGAGWFGQIGNGEMNNKNIPIEINSLKSEIITAISCGWNHCLALSLRGMLYGWGANNYGQLGIGNINTENNPTLIAFNDCLTVMKICCGCDHSLILTEHNDIYSFGENTCGQLGIGSDINQNKPTKIQSSVKFIDIETKFHNKLCVGLSIDNKYYVWGECSDQSINTPTQTNCNSFNETFHHYSQITTLCQAIVTNESFFSSENWFINKFSKLKTLLNNNQNITSSMTSLTLIRLRECKAILVTNDDMVYSFSFNDGIGSKSVQSLSQVKDLSKIRIKTIRCGYCHVLVLTENNQVYSFGDNYYGQLGDGSRINNYKPSLITELTDKHITEISCGAYHCLALTECGRVFVWGNGCDGQIGNGETRHKLTPYKIEAFVSVKVNSICCGAFHCLALSSSGELYGWGDYRYGQSGIGNRECHSKPTIIEMDANVIINKISCSYWHSILLTTDHNVYSFGSNSFGQLGIGNQSHQNRVIKLNTSIQFKDIYTEWCDQFTAGLSQSGKYYIWGKCGHQVITTPKQTHLSSFDEIFAKYSQFRFTAKQIDLN